VGHNKIRHCSGSMGLDWSTNNFEGEIQFCFLQKFLSQIIFFKDQGSKAQLILFTEIYQQFKHVAAPIESCFGGNSPFDYLPS